MIHREYHRWYSNNLHQEMELLVFGKSGARVIVFPTRCGRFFDYENWRIAASIREKINNGELQLFCVDSVDAQSLYCDWCEPIKRIEKHIQYERYIIDEVLPFSKWKNSEDKIVLHGCSLGAYHALNLGFKHPHLFSKIVSFSGRYNLCENVGSYRDLFDGFHNEDIYYNNPSQYFPNLTEPYLLEQIKKLEIIITIGEEDALLQNNIALSNAMNEKGVKHQLYIWHEEAHRAYYWRKMVQLYL